MVSIDENDYHGYARDFRAGSPGEPLRVVLLANRLFLRFSEPVRVTKRDEPRCRAAVCFDY
jgi:hypothetical protein